MVIDWRCDKADRVLCLDDVAVTLNLYQQSSNHSIFCFRQCTTLSSINMSLHDLASTLQYHVSTSGFKLEVTY